MQLFESIFSNIMLRTNFDYMYDFYALLKPFICSFKKHFYSIPFSDNIIHFLQNKMIFYIIILLTENKNDLYKIASHILN